MGKGDRRSRRGKLFRGTFGKTRKHSAGTSAVIAPKAVAAETKTEVPKKKRATKKKVE